MLFDTVCVVGVGLVGGSFGMAVRERGLAAQVVGAVRRQATIEHAINRGAIDFGTLDLQEAVATADLVFMAPPVAQMKSLCERMAPVLKPGAIVTDGGSTKVQIVAECTPLIIARACFVGGHPMAGGEQMGVESARADLFENAVWILTPTAETSHDALNAIKQLVENLGALPLLMTPEAHDAILAVTSHLPHLTAAALVHLFAEARDENQLAEKVVASGWRDSTRIAAGSPEMWRDICLANAPAIAGSLDGLIAQLELVRALLEDGNGDRLFEWFDKARTVRQTQAKCRQKNG